MSCRPVRVPGGALRTHWTGLTCRGGEAHYDRFSATFSAGRPDRVGHALWAGHAVVVPVDGERGAVETATGPSLRRVVDAQRAQQRDPEVVPGADHQLGGGVAGIHDVLVREQVAVVEAGVDVFQHLHVGEGRIGRGNVGDEVGQAGGGRIVAGLAEVDLVAFPAAAALGGVSSVGVIGRADPFSAGREIVVLPPCHLHPCRW